MFFQFAMWSQYHKYCACSFFLIPYEVLKEAVEAQLAIFRNGYYNHEIQKQVNLIQYVLNKPFLLDFLASLEAVILSDSNEIIILLERNHD